MSDTIALMNKGKLEQVGSPQQLYLQPKTRFVAGFLGAVNWMGPIGVRPEATRISRQKPDENAKGSAAIVEGRNVLRQFRPRRGEACERRDRDLRVFAVGRTV